jgi:hypothetical protein
MEKELISPSELLHDWKLFCPTEKQMTLSWKPAQITFKHQYEDESI